MFLRYTAGNEKMIRTLVDIISSQQSMIPAQVHTTAFESNDHSLMYSFKFDRVKKLSRLCLIAAHDVSTCI